MGGAIDELPPGLREPIRLHYDQEKSYLEIALELGISYENVRKRMSQARAILREKLSEFVGEEDGLRPEPRKRGKSKKRSLRVQAVGESLPWVLPVGSGEPVGAALYALQGEPASFEPSVEGVLGIVAGGEPIAVFSGMKYASITRKGGGHGGPPLRSPGFSGPHQYEKRSKAGRSVAPASFEALEEEPLGIVAGGEPAGLSVVPVAPAQGETCLDLELGIAAGGEPLLGGLDTGRIMKILCTVLGTPLSQLKAGWGTEGGTGGRTGGRTGGTPVLRREVGASVWDGHLGQKEPHAGVREMRWLLGLCWRVWADSGGGWLSSI